jgi:hypothetical protein
MTRAMSCWIAMVVRDMPHQQYVHRVHINPSCKTSGIMATKGMKQQQQKEEAHLHIMFPVTEY